jgi:chromatin segregation and condensation protein Rec8/ScpA/Scc1 (kleisin family)
VSKRKPELKLVEDTGSELLAEELIPELPPQQSEMPFAVVEGEPMTELPRDLYIPPDALQVFLEAFEGPLDLLLYLIRKQNLDILDIPIAEITRQYMKYIDVMADLQLELAGEYLLMAAMLAEIKSRMLLPRPPSADGQDEDDPRAELVRRLQEYERFKKAAEDIDKLARLERDTMPASAELQERKVVTLMPDVTLKEMLMAFKDVLSRAEKFAHHHITRERLSQRERMSEILNRLQTTAFFEFTQLFRPEEGRMGVTVTFIAILELMKEGLIEIVQAEAYAPIHVRTAQRHLKVVSGNAAVVASVEADAENVAALAQPELEGENDVDDEIETPAEAAQPEDAAVEGALAEAEAVAVALGIDEVVTSDAAPAEPAAAADELAGTTPPTEDLSAEAAEPVIVPDAEEQAPDVSVEEIADRETIVVALDASEESPELLAGEAQDAAAADQVLASDAQASVVLETEASEEQGAAPETTVEEHVVEEHVVPEHVVEENVVPEHVVEESTAQLDPAEPAIEDQPAVESAESNEQSSEQHHEELSPDDDSVTESSSEADNSDAEPSR